VKKLVVVLFSSALAVAALARPVFADNIKQVNLVSNIPGLADFTDPNLINPWGLSFSATSPFWAADQGSGKSTLYGATGLPNALIVTVPPGSPTGTVFVGGAGFTITDPATNLSAPANFAFATLAGTIDVWGGAAGTVAQIKFTEPGAVYTGLALVGSKLYAADAAGNTIDVIDTTFGKVAVPGTFVDPGVPAGFNVYNVQNIGGKLYVTYAPPPGSSLTGGFVAVFDADGNLLQHIDDSHLVSPWGVTLAPAGFALFGGSLLVGNFGDGMINAFDPVTGAFLGTLIDHEGDPIVNEGLWALAFRQGGGAFDPNALYFTAGINGEEDGLFGKLVADPIPEPATLSLVAIGLAGLGARRRRRP
jgi:uncharacterized protein (TIGR03118 family)